MFGVHLCVCLSMFLSADVCVYFLYMREACVCVCVSVRLCVSVCVCVTLRNTRHAIFRVVSFCSLLSTSTLPLLLINNTNELTEM